MKDRLKKVANVWCVKIMAERTYIIFLEQKNFWLTVWRLIIICGFWRDWLIILEKQLDKTSF